MAREPKVCFSVVGATKPIYDGDFATYYESVVVFGCAEKVENPALKEKALICIAKKYLPQHIDKAPEYIDKLGSGVAVYSISIDRITGKARRAKK